MKTFFNRHLRDLKKVGKSLGPGVITGASDDDPSGIMTYLLAGARHGLSLLWIAFITIPLMVAVQEMCARIGIVTKRGLVGNMKRLFPSWLLYLIALLVVVANTFNITANFAGMIGSLQLFIPLPSFVLGVVMLFCILIGLLFFSYKNLASIFRWLTLPLLAYIGAALLSGVDLLSMISHTLIPTNIFDRTTLLTICAVLGTTISPYLFFWQASEEVEETKLNHSKTNTTKELKFMHKDVLTGMILSNLVMYFIIAAGSSAFHQSGSDITSLAQAASALTPVAGPLATILFCLGLIGTGMLAIPVLAGSAAYVVSEAFGWPEGLGKKFHQAPQFYLIITMTLVAGLGLSVLNFDPIQMLFATALVYGFLSPILIFLILIIANNKKLMGTQTNSHVSNLINIVALVLMALAGVGALIL